VTRKTNRPEDLWAGATYQQVADLREWIQSRMKRRHADSISAWLLSLGTDEQVEPHKRQLAFFRRILDEYGPPRPAIAGNDGAQEREPENPPESTSENPPESTTENPPNAPRTDPEGPATHPAGRFHRA
jgi:hypothetical protein